MAVGERIACEKTLPLCSDAQQLVFEIIMSLYWDQIKPCEADIYRRLFESGACCTQPGHLPPEVWRIFELPHFRIFHDKTLRKVVELSSPPDWFSGWIDLNEDSGDLNINVWNGLEHFVACIACDAHPSENTGVAGQEHKYQFKGGRYGLARRLQECVLCLYRPENVISCQYCRDFFESIQFWSLGRLCHLVQAGINGGILRYEDNMLQPACVCKANSAAFASRLTRDESTTRFEPEEPAGRFSAGVVTREICSVVEFEEYLEALFQEERLSELPLSQLKKKLISSFEIVLNPSRLGFVKVSDVIKSMKDFDIVSEGNNAFVRRRDESPSTCITVASPLNSGLSN